MRLDGFSKHGLVHISQLAQHRVEAVEDVVAVDEPVLVKVIRIEDGKLSCSMKAVDQQTGESLADRSGGRRSGGERGGSDALPELFSIHRAQVHE